MRSTTWFEALPGSGKISAVASIAPPAHAWPTHSGRLDANTARLSHARATSCGGVYSYPAGGALVPRATLEAGVYVCVPSTFDKWDGAFELIVCAPEGAVRIEMVPG